MDMVMDRVMDMIHACFEIKAHILNKHIKIKAINKKLNIYSYNNII